MALVSQPKKPMRPLSHAAPAALRMLFMLLMLFMAAAGLVCPPAAGRPWAADGNGLPPPPALPELVRTKHPVFSIPFSPPAAQSPDSAAQRVVLSASKDLGATWEPAGEAAPNAGSFTYRAGSDGEYWFRLRSIDSKGRLRGGAGPDLRVLVDAAGPKLAARVWKGTDGEIICRYAAVDDSLRLDSLAFDYRGKGDQGWKKVAAVGILSRESPAHMVGEEIWWAGEQVEAITVRIAISDASGNNTVRQFTLEQTDPQVDQAALARELGAPPLPSQEVPVNDLRPRTPALPAAARPTPASDAMPLSADGWRSESAAAWSAESPAEKAAAIRGPQSVLVNRVGSGAPAGPLSAVGTSSGISSGAFPGTSPAADALALPEASPLADVGGGMALANGQQPLVYRGKPLQLVQARRFAWDYEYQADDTAAGGVRVELWSTRDGGVTWQRSAVDDDTTSPISVTLPSSGLYGFRLEVVSDLPNAAGGPVAGDMPDTWVGVDDEPPQVELIEVARAKAGEPPGVVIRYTARDQMLVPRSTRLAYSPNAAGPWATIGESLDNQGEHRWQPPRGVTAKVFIRVEAADAAGNVGSTTSAQPVTVSAPRVTGRLGGVRPLSPSAP
jgi:hypothetical protein